jgi:competence protein ComEC
MLVFLLFSVFVSFFVLRLPPVSSATPVRELHSICVKVCPHVVHADFIRAIVCGESLPIESATASLHGDFVRTGLIHLLVVSGSHLICLEAWVRFLSKPLRSEAARDALVFSVLATFTVMTKGSPPVARAFASWLLSIFSERFRMSWTRTQVLTMSGFVTLIVCRSRWDFASLLLSWVAALGYALASAFFRRRKRRDSPSRSLARSGIDALRTHAVVYVALIPALVSLGVPSVVSIFCNLMFAPAMGFVLFPVSCFGFAGLGALANEAWTLALWLVSHAAAVTPAPWSPADVSPLALVPYLIALTFGLFALERGPRIRSHRGFVQLTLVMALLSLSPASHADELIVWNVGQGSWATLKSEGVCEHFDMGGEHAPQEAIASMCARARTEVYFSHWDWDHIGLTQTARKLLPKLCVQAQPGGPAPNSHKAALIAGLPRCEDTPHASEIFLSHLSSRAKLRSANDFSQVFTQDDIVFPGDSPDKEEVLWRTRAGHARILIAGHHGSKTSTSEALLEKLTDLKEIVASARKQKYGHPHPAMLARAQRHLLPVITTEEWGSLHFEIRAEINGEKPRSETSNPQMEFRRKALPAFRSRARVGGTNPAIQ